ncbi:MAG: hypothetical protein IJ215_02120 [Clostridia bacterium]|nr:hypothetical protein [Clostridia bacterium]
MKKKFVILVIVLILMIMIFNAFSKKNTDSMEFKPIDIDVGEEFTNLSYDQPMYVLNYAIKDVTGDGRNDMIIVIGEKDNIMENGPANNIDVVVYNSSGENFIKGGLKKCTGKAPRIMTANVDESENDEIILVTENEDTTKNIKVLSITDNVCKEIFKPRDNKGLVVSGYFMDGFKVYVSIRKLKLETYIDIKDYKDSYMNNGFYDADGRVLSENKNITSGNFVEVELVQLNGQYGIKTVQRIKGFDNLDILDEIEVLWKYEGGNWNIKEANSKRLGNLLY